MLSRLTVLKKFARSMTHDIMLRNNALSEKRIIEMVDIEMERIQPMILLFYEKLVRIQFRGLPKEPLNFRLIDYHNILHSQQCGMSTQTDLFLTVSRNRGEAVYGMVAIDALIGIPFFEFCGRVGDILSVHAYHLALIYGLGITHLCKRTQVRIIYSDPKFLGEVEDYDTEKDDVLRDMRGLFERCSFTQLNEKFLYGSELPKGKLKHMLTKDYHFEFLYPDAPRAPYEYIFEQTKEINKYVNIGQPYDFPSYI